MATRSTISILTKEGGKTIYCHWDGYPKNNGKILLDHYKTEERVLELMALGNLSILHANIGEKVEFHGFDSEKSQQCLAYGRDRGETGEEATSFTNLPERSEEYNYLFKNGKWYVSTDENFKFTRLTQQRCRDNY